MDSVRVNIQIRELIETIIKSNPDFQVKVNNAIIDSISKRLVTKVLTNVDGAVKLAIDDASREISKQYLQYSGNSWRGEFELTDKEKSTIRNEINLIWREEFNKAIEEARTRLVEEYKRNLQWAVESYVQKFKEELPSLPDIIKEEVEKYFKSRLK
jgi:hypothetical protein